MVLFFLVAGVRIGARSDLHEGDQPKQADYVLDIVCNGNWIVQHHADGSVMSKPPLYNWLAAPLVMLFGAEDIFLKMPSLLAGLAVVLMAWDMARRRLSPHAALWGVTFLILSSMFAKQIYYARTDVLLTCFIVMQFWAILRWDDDGARESSIRNKWLWIFWCAAALGCLTKGPLAFLPHLALAPLWLVEKRFKEKYARLGVWWGLPLAVLPLAVWFLMAWRVEGDGLYERMVKAEMTDRFLPTAEKISAQRDNRPFFYYLPQVFGRTLPWSLFGLIGLCGAMWARRNTELSERQRGMLRFLAAWFFAALIFFSLIPSKRVDRIFPVVPALCLLGGWAFDRLMNMRRAAGVYFTVIAAVFIVGSVGLMMPALGVDVARLKILQGKIPPGTLESIVSKRVLVTVACAIMTVAAAAALVLVMRRRLTHAAWLLVSCNLAFVVLYQQVLGNWMQTDYCEGALPVCREVRRRARAEGAKIMLLAGSGPAARFYLLQAGLEIPPSEAAKRLAAPHPALYVVGTLPYVENNPRRKVDERKPGTIEEAGLSKAHALPRINEQPLSATKWLGAVRVPQRE